MLPIASIDPRLSRQMHGSWLDQFEVRDASRMKIISDEAAQKALELRCQRQFVLKLLSFWMFLAAAGFAFGRVMQSA
jgi:hypothetical protein